METRINVDEELADALNRLERYEAAHRAILMRVKDIKSTKDYTAKEKEILVTEIEWVLSLFGKTVFVNRPIGRRTTDETEIKKRIIAEYKEQREKKRANMKKAIKVHKEKAAQARKEKREEEVKVAADEIIQKIKKGEKIEEFVDGLDIKTNKVYKKRLEQKQQERTQRIGGSETWAENEG